VDDLDGVARGAQTLTDVLSEDSARGWSGQFVSRGDARIECETCHRSSPASEFAALALRRLEGASDPDDMLAVAAVECPECGARGSLVLNYGPLASDVDAAVLVALPTPAG
jgi:hypothetical protein